jgi:adenylate cyclase
MADIFISYSSKDREKAEQLTELLSSAGLSVWIDRQGIGAATSWSGEISKAIEECKALVLLLSPTSIESDNVRKEVSLAAERQKKILPLDLEPVTLPHDLAYHLAGIQRTSMTNIDSIIRALGKLGLEATQAPTLKLVKETDSRKSLMILPFEDLSPTADNGWFADGIVSELINVLSNIKALRVTDAATTKEYKSFKGHLTTYAHEMQIRYFVQGDVRKFGDQIKVSARLLDIDTGDHLWQDSIKATMADIFDVQEAVANKVVDGLKLHLTSEEKKKLAGRGTENSEAYELYLKAHEYYQRQTKEGFQISAKLNAEAIALDPGYAEAYSSKAGALAMLYRSYDRNHDLLLEAEALSKEALRLKPGLFDAFNPLSQIYMHQGKHAEAEEIAKEYIRKAPENYSSHFALGFFYNDTGQYLKAIAPYEEASRLKPDDRVALLSLVVACYNHTKTTYDKSYEEKRITYARIALPHFERHLKLHPDDQNARQQYADMLFFSGSIEDARMVAQELKEARDANILFNTACLFADIGDKQEALATFRKAIEAGFSSIHHLNEFLTEEHDGIVQLADTPEYEEVKRMVEQIEREAETKKHG